MARVSASPPFSPSPPPTKQRRPPERDTTPRGEGLSNETFITKDYQLPIAPKHAERMYTIPAASVPKCLSMHAPTCSSAHQRASVQARRPELARPHFWWAENLTSLWYLGARLSDRRSYIGPSPAPPECLNILGGAQSLAARRTLRFTVHGSSCSMVQTPNDATRCQGTCLL
ncbi:hypothetical protein CC85DRAFT_169961 [Cutaneotrichosporon oleaginosum]|uniref:Uncharacterized protein n=1 Tax=Cutaneotrichosporon oleaginosum TaxID=879819 RepID=A0A0J1BAT3_9TREE|nr:uncharacterized protein CC85DRAFT_169961 [Cutaneotrichosporon oleaginosum]KLT45029.1 hypothetical protein CC85DRAFT_169961 [Cutaneotrichosporon oleaginosum]TXT09716.1 hypothetical protein COLE_03650 [Cutaneotrichosporon oleaginosum]